MAQSEDLTGGPCRQPQRCHDSFMRTIRTGRTPHEVVEVHDNENCSACGALLVTPHVQFSSVGCSVHGHHRTIRCLDCDHFALEPPCDTPSSGHGSLYG